MLKVKILLIALITIALCQGQTTETVTATYNGYAVPIYPDDWDSTAVAAVTVSKALKMSTVTVRVNIQYPQVGDLNVFLYSPDGTRVKLLEHTCGSLTNVNTTFDDAAPNKFADFCPVEAGRGPFRPNESLSRFAEADSSIGVWILAVENDRSDSRSGLLIDYSLTITGTSQSPPIFRADQVLNPANLRSGVVAPGQVVSITGSSLGPTVPVLTPAGQPWPTGLGNVRVSVNGVPAPIRYASATRLDVQMPFDLVVPATIQINYGSNNSAPVTVPVQNTFPGLFAMQSGGTGQARASNQDWTANSSTNAAARGTYIIVWGVGLGAVTPAAVAGQVAPNTPLYNAVNKVAASIGGAPAEVSFAGLAPGVVGAYQINILVPPNAPTGRQEVIISNGGNASQNGIYVYVK